jgi:hypothetical protein
MDSLEILQGAKEGGVTARDAWEIIMNPINPDRFPDGMAPCLMRVLAERQLIRVYGDEAKKYFAEGKS